MSNERIEIALARTIATSTLTGGLVAGLAYILVFDLLAEPCAGIMCNFDLAIEVLVSAIVVGSAVFWVTAAGLVGRRLVSEDRWLTAVFLLVAGPILTLIPCLVVASMS